MANFHCVLDASALIKKYHKENGSEIVEATFEHSDTAIHLLNVAIPEVIGTFFRWQLKGKLTPTKRNQLKKIFLEDVKSYKIVIHNINDRNIVETDNVWETSIAVPAPHYYDANSKRKEKPRVGPIDVLVLSVCQELKTSYKMAFLFSSDEHMLKVGEKLGISTHDPEKIQRLPF